MAGWGLLDTTWGTNVVHPSLSVTIGPCLSILEPTRSLSVQSRRFCHVKNAHVLQSYANYNPVEREIRRRVLWLCIGGDITSSVLGACSPVASESLYADVDLPGLA